MKPAQRRWVLPDCVPLPDFPPLLGQVLAVRGFTVASAGEFLRRGVFLDPFGLPDMERAVEVVGKAIAARTRIAVYGDYDVDGVTACALLTRALRAAGADVLPWIPNRMTDGYGLHASALAELGAQGVGCTITVDCGTSSVEAAASRPTSMALVITDHHLPRRADGTAPPLAPADAVINPKRDDSTYGFDGLAGAGVAWKLVQALETAGAVPAGSAFSLMPYAALGTVADVMPLEGENRKLVQEGLPMVAAGAYPGIAALCAVGGISAATLRATDVAYGLAPRINAAGRMEDARRALELCLSEDPDECHALAQQLELQNQERKTALAKALEAAEARVEEMEEAPAIVLGDRSWPMGIVGLVAGRLAERYGCPAFIASLDPHESKGSARSAGDIHLVDVLDQAASTMLRYGGHKLAAGFSLEEKHFPEFTEAILAAVEQRWKGRSRERVFRIDITLPLGEANAHLMEQVAALEPFGQGNAEPLVAFMGCEIVESRCFGAGDAHVRMTVGGAGNFLEAVAFNRPGLAVHLYPGRIVDLCGTLSVNRWRGEERMQLLIRDVQPATGAVHAGGGTGASLGAAQSGNLRQGEPSAAS